MSLLSLLQDYSCTYGFLTSGVDSYIKDILTKIGFQSHPQRSHSEIVYDTSEGGSYVEAALSFISVSSQQLVCNVAERLRDDINSVKLMSWPPRVEELEKEELSPLVVQLLSALRGKKAVDLSPSTHCLSYLSHHLVCHKTAHHYCHQCHHTLHGMTCSKELVDTYRLGMGINS